MGIYLASFHGDWWAMFFFIFFAAVFGFFAYIFPPTQQKDIYRYELTNEGLHQQWLHKPTSQETKQFVPFDEIDQVLIGIYAERVRIPDSKNYFRYHAMLIIMHNDEYFIEKFLSADDLQEWIKRLKGNVANLQYTNYDLYEAYYAQFYTKIDFSKIEGNKQDCVSHLIGRETLKNILFSWQPEGIEEAIYAQEKITNISDVRRAEKRTNWILLFYNFLFAVFILGGTPLEKDNIIEITDAILVVHLLLIILISCILVFWRRFTKWYLPILLTRSSSYVFHLEYVCHSYFPTYHLFTNPFLVYVYFTLCSRPLQ